MNKLALYEVMLRIRRTEEQLARSHEAGLIPHRQELEFVE